jgi:hypothetical protein
VVAEERRADGLPLDDLGDCTPPVILGDLDDVGHVVGLVPQADRIEVLALRVRCALERFSAGSWYDEQRAQVRLLRDLAGNPFSSPPALDPTWLEWNGGLVVNLARAIYEERAWERMPILGDALEDAGCADAPILGHCRTQLEHARG